MSEIKRNEIIYEEGWRENAVTRIGEDAPEDEADVEPVQTGSGRPLLICIQLVLCLLAALVLFLLKAMGSEYYDAFSDGYHEELEKPIVSRGAFDAYDLSRLFPQEQIKATADEAEIG